MAEFGISELSYQKLQHFFAAQSDIEQVIIYGSRAKGANKTGSDVDFCLKGKNLTTNRLAQIAIQLEDLETPYFYDLVLYSLLAPHFLTEIQQSGKIFYLNPTEINRT